MRVWVTLHIGPHDRPVIEVTPADGDVDEGMTVRLDEDVSLTGDRAHVERWVRDLATQVAMQEVT